MIQGFDNNDTIHRLRKAKSLSFSGYGSTVKADGVIGVNCNFTSLEDAIAAGERSIFVKGSFAHTGVSKTAGVQGGSMTITSNVAHGFFVNDLVVFTASELDGVKLLQGVFNVDAINGLDFDITLVNNTATYPTKLGGFTSGKNVSFHKADKKTVVFAANIDYTGLNVVGESKDFSTLAGSDCLDFGSSTSILTSMNFENIGLRPSSSGGICIQLGATIEMNDIVFEKCLFNGFQDATYNGVLWGGAFSITSNAKIDNILFNFCTFKGIFSARTDICIDFDNFSANNGTNLKVDNCTFKTINGVGIVFGRANLGYRCTDSTFIDIYNRGIFVDATVIFSSVGTIEGNTFRNGIDTAFVATDPKDPSIVVDGNVLRLDIRTNVFDVQGAVALRPFFAIEIKNNTLILMGSIVNNRFNAIRSVAIELGAGDTYQVIGNSFGGGVTAINFGSTNFKDSIVKNNLMFAGVNILTGTAGANVTQVDNFRFP